MAPTPQQCDLIRFGFLTGNLKIRSVAKDLTVQWRPIERVMRTPTYGRPIVKVLTPHGEAVMTSDHRVCTSGEDRVEAGRLRPGNLVVCQEGQKPVRCPVGAVMPMSPRSWVYNLSVQENRNFLLHQSQLYVKNSPDKFYHFRPPEHEGRVGHFNRVFGQIWEDQELLLYLRRAIDDWSLVPPSTDRIRTIEEIWSRYPGWRSGITWGAIVHALFAVMLNWIADEFDYSIGGVSLSIEKSSKYQSAMGDAKDMWDKAAEGKGRTTKYMLGLKQPRFGVGVRSAFGPSSGRSSLGPRAFTM